MKQEYPRNFPVSIIISTSSTQMLVQNNNRITPKVISLVLILREITLTVDNI